MLRKRKYALFPLQKTTLFCRPYPLSILSGQSIVDEAFLPSLPYNLIYYWACSRPKFNLKTAPWLLSNHQSIKGIVSPSKMSTRFFFDLNTFPESIYFSKNLLPFPILSYIYIYIYIYYEYSLLHIFSLVLQPWMSAYIRKTDGVYMYVFGLPHLGPKKQKYLRFTESIS